MTWAEIGSAIIGPALGLLGVIWVHRTSGRLDDEQAVREKAEKRAEDAALAFSNRLAYDKEAWTRLNDVVRQANETVQSLRDENQLLRSQRETVLRELADRLAELLDKLAELLRQMSQRGE